MRPVEWAQTIEAAEDGVAKQEESDDRAGPGRASRKLLQLLVRADSSRFAGKRLGAAMGIVGLLGAFGAAGYWLPALIARLLAR